ncbi:MAG TPA: DUF305 domain-containing protein [Vicinamibacterales bacterium]|jgi:uncharacterized protein (DUF305 family)
MRSRLLVGIAIVGSACIHHAEPAPVQTPPIVQPGAPGQPSTTITPERSRDLSAVAYTGADIKFMQGMIGHHAQALEMVELLKKNSSSDDMKKLGLRIELSQDDEIRMMQNWLAVRGQRVPSRTELHQHGAQLMPGMLTEDEMRQLAAAKGPAFDRLFLEGMIKHHGGALQMVRELVDTPGAAQASDVFSFAADVEADQRAEIDRMSAMLSAIK